jgi:hypothetical protein
MSKTLPNALKSETSRGSDPETSGAEDYSIQAVTSKLN